MVAGCLKTTTEVKNYTSFDAANIKVPTGFIFK